MGLKDHLEDGTGRALSPGLDLDYLHVESSERATRLSTRAGSGHKEVLRAREVNLGAGTQDPTSSGCRGEGDRIDSGCSIYSSTSGSIYNSTTGSTSLSSDSGRSSCSNWSEESAVSDSEDEQGCSSQRCTDPGPGLEQYHSPGDPAPLPGYHSKVEFALKLGYTEDLILLVLRKVGPEAQINDILGELVKLGGRAEMDSSERGTSFSLSSSPSSLSSSSLSPSSLSSSTSSLESCRTVCSPQENKENLRPVVLDGSNVAMSHGNKEVFSCQGIQLAVDWFLERGHRDITVFVPAWRKEQSRPDALITDQEILRRLEKEKILVFTPSRRVQGRRVVCYDDRFIVKLAYESDGIIVSNDNYRDLANEKPEWKKLIDERLLMYSFVNDKFMPPDDPLGRHGPSLDNFLRKRPVLPEHRKQPCPYGKKCTYGHKCKFYHPERGTQPQRAVADELRASAKSSSSASKHLLGDALMGTPQSLPSSQREATSEAGPTRDPPKKLLDPRSSNFSLSDLLEERLGVRRGSSGRGSNSSSMDLPAPGDHPSFVSQDRWDHPGGAGGSARAAGASRPNLTKTHLSCESPELAYSSLIRAYSGLSMAVPKSPERFFLADLRAGPLPSDCSSESSVGSKSFSPDPLLENDLKCHHHHTPQHPHRYHVWYPPYTSRLSQPTEHHNGQSYSLPPPSQRPPDYGVEDPSLLFNPPSPYMPPHPQRQTLGGHARGTGEYSSPPTSAPQASEASSAHAYSQSSSSSRRDILLGSPWRDGRLPDVRLYEGSPPHSTRGYPGLNQEQQRMSWGPQYQQHAQPSYEPFPLSRLPEGRETAWHAPWGRCTRSSAHSSPLPHQALPTAVTAHVGHPPSAALHQDLGCYQDLREKVFVNLCNIFPQDLVRVVMARNPHMTDAQQLAAAILMEKSQHGY